MKQRMMGSPRTGIERAAAHFGIPEEAVTQTHIDHLPTRGYGLQAGTAAGLFEDSGKILWVGLGVVIGGLATYYLKRK